jgi:DNA-binding response OmpR family regulator
VTKPIEPDQLLQAVVRLVQRHSLESSNSSTSSNLSDSRV